MLERLFWLLLALLAFDNEDELVDLLLPFRFLQGKGTRGNFSRRFGRCFFDESTRCIDRNFASEYRCLQNNQQARQPQKQNKKGKETNKEMKHEYTSTQTGQQARVTAKKKKKEKKKRFDTPSLFIDYTHFHAHHADFNPTPFFGFVGLFAFVGTLTALAGARRCP